MIEDEAVKGDGEGDGAEDMRDDEREEDERGEDEREEDVDDDRI